MAKDYDTILGKLDSISWNLKRIADTLETLTALNESVDKVEHVHLQDTTNLRKFLQGLGTENNFTVEVYSKDK